MRTRHHWRPSRCRTTSTPDTRSSTARDSSRTPLSIGSGRPRRAGRTPAAAAAASVGCSSASAAPWREPSRVPAAGAIPMSGSTGSIPELRSPNPVTTLTREFRRSYAFIERNLFLIKRYWGWEIAFLVYAIDERARPSPSSASEQDDQALRAVADDRRHLLELPLDRVRLHRRDRRLGALGGHARVHLHGAHPALDAAARARRCSRCCTASSTRP